jgi:hypothetical protein
VRELKIRNLHVKTNLNQFTEEVYHSEPEQREMKKPESRSGNGHPKCWRELYAHGGRNLRGGGILDSRSITLVLGLVTGKRYRRPSEGHAEGLDAETYR